MQVDVPSDEVLHKCLYKKKKFKNPSFWAIATYILCTHNILWSVAAYILWTLNTALWSIAAYIYGLLTQHCDLLQSTFMDP